jgi:enoyl-CoA hydratase/carnithine racemase
MKYLVNNALDTSTPIGLRMEFQHAEMHRTSDDYVEGLAAFNEKRTPNFIGR